LGAVTPTFDARELRRWGIGEDRLLPGSVVLFREPTAWQRYRPQIIAGVTVASVQTMFAIALLASLVKRRRAERSLRVSEESSKLASVALSGLSRRLLQSHEEERALDCHKAQRGSLSTADGSQFTTAQPEHGFAR
jgi:hypothetical protein